MTKKGGLERSILTGYSYWDSSLERRRFLPYLAIWRDYLSWPEELYGFLTQRLKVSMVFHLKNLISVSTQS